MTTQQLTSAHIRRGLAMLVLIALGVLAFTALTGPSAAYQDPTATPAPPADGPTATPAAQATTAVPATTTPVPTATLTPYPTSTPSAPTLVPPTPMPTLTPTPYIPPEQSALAAAQTLDALRVGTYYNAFPFSWMNERGEIVGYEADILRAIGIELGIEIEFTQVTRNNDENMLLSERVDVLIGQQVHTRDRDDQFDFSHPYYANHHMMVVLTDSPYNTLQDLAGQPVGVAIGSRSERALHNWSVLHDVAFEVRTYFTEDAALNALEAGEVAGVVGPLDSLRRAGRQGMRLLSEPVLSSYYGIVLREGDVNLRNVLNRSLQRLKASGRLDAILGEWFREDPVDFDRLVPVYDALYQDERALDDFPTDMPYPDQSVVERIANGQSIRVAGLVPSGQEAPNALYEITNAFNDALIREMTLRWGVQIESVPGSALNAVDAVANGQADIAVGVSPRWDGADRVEYSHPYIRHGDRLAVPENSQIVNGFQDMLGTGWWIGYFADDAPDKDKIIALADIFGVSKNVREPFAIQREDDALYTMVVENNLDAIFGDNLRLTALIRDGYEDRVRIVPTPYGDELPIAFAMPRNDSAFRALVNNTLQDMAEDGTYQRLWEEHFAIGDPLSIITYASASPDVKITAQELQDAPAE